MPWWVGSKGTRQVKKNAVARGSLPADGSPDGRATVGGSTSATNAAATPTAKPAPLTLQGRRIEEALLKVIQIESACLGKNEDTDEEGDEFVTLKKELYTCLFVTKNMIRERCQLLAERGNTVETIQKASLANKNIEMMQQKFGALKEVFKKQARQVNKNFTAAELDIRFNELQVIKRQVEECQDLMKRGTEYSDEQVKTLTDFLGQMERAGVQAPQQFDAGNGGGWREPSPEEQAVMNRWAARDKEFDQQIWKVGEGIDRLNAIAVDIGSKAEQQGRLAIDLSRQADEANQEVIEINEKLKQLLTSGGGMNFCCKLLLTLILIALLGFIAQNVANRIKGSLGLTANSSPLIYHLSSHGALSTPTKMLDDFGPSQIDETISSLVNQHGALIAGDDEGVEHGKPVEEAVPGGSESQHDSLRKRSDGAEPQHDTSAATNYWRTKIGLGTLAKRSRLSQKNSTTGEAGIALPAPVAAPQVAISRLDRSRNRFARYRDYISTPDVGVSPEGNGGGSSNSSVGGVTPAGGGITPWTRNGRLRAGVDGGELAALAALAAISGEPLPQGLYLLLNST